MHETFELGLRSDVALQIDGPDWLITCPADSRALRLAKPGAALQAMLQAIQAGGMNAARLLNHALKADAQANGALLHYTLLKLHGKGFLTYTLRAADQPLATLAPMAPGFRWLKADAGAAAYRLSRFAVLRPQGAQLLLECGLSHACLTVHDPRLGMWLAQLAQPQTAAQLATTMAAAMSGSAPATAHVLAQNFLDLLVAMGAANACDAAGRLPEDDVPLLRTWEAHDLNFHARTRAGRHSAPAGGTFRFAHELPHPPALHPRRASDLIALRKPDATELPADRFFDVVEARRSIRQPGERAIQIDQLSAFFWFVARMQAHQPADANNPTRYESLWRPVPAGGALHEIELYATVQRCNGLTPGLYRYVPEAHALEPVANLGTDQQVLLNDARQAAGLQEPPDILLTLAARFARLTWKYEGMAYALMLKNAGALYGHMYLVATALRLAPCGLGGGNAEHFARAAGLNYYEEGSVGEFLLSAQ